jgi:23S rRNA pseudouridine1911/1915/1917 synthase
MNPRVNYLRAVEPQALSQILKQAALTDEKIADLFYHGAVYCNGLRHREDCDIAANDVIRVHLEPKKFLAPGTEWIPEVLYQDDDLLVIDKPGGLPTHPTLDNFNENAKELAEKFFGYKIYVTHRLDIPTSGVLLLAKNPEAQRGINKMFAKRRIQKIYRATVENPVAAGSYVHYLDPKSKTPKQVSLDPQEGWLDCRMSFKHLDNSQKNLEIELETGRTHQIRAQLAALGSPIVGDVDYGAREPLSPMAPRDFRFVQGRIALECYQLSFTFRSKALSICRNHGGHRTILKSVFDIVE